MGWLLLLLKINKNNSLIIYSYLNLINESWIIIIGNIILKI